MKRRIALSLLALLGVAGLSACRRAPLMFDVKQVVPPGLLPETLWQSSKVSGLRQAILDAWQVLGEVLKREQVELFKAPADYNMQQAIDFYQQRLGDERWQLRRSARNGYDSAAWVAGGQALLVCWNSELIQWGNERVRLVMVFATLGPESSRA